MKRPLYRTKPVLTRIVFVLLVLSGLFPFIKVTAQDAIQDAAIRNVPVMPNPLPNYHLGPQLLPLSAPPDTLKDSQGGPLLLETSCNNSNFSTGTWNNWIGCFGYFDPVTNCQTPGFSLPGMYPHPLHKLIPSPGWEDAQTCYGLINVFPGEAFAARLGDTMYTAQGTPKNIPKEAELKYAVSVNSNSYLFIYRYAIILQTGGHNSNQQPDFKVQITNAAGVELDPTCGSYYITAQNNGPPAPGWGLCTAVTNGNVYWKGWTTVGMDLTPYYGQTVYLNFKVRGCTYDTHFGYGYISAYCSALAIQIGLCAGSSTATLTAPPGFQTYEWRGPGYNGPVIGTTPSIIIGAPQAGDVYYVNLTAVNGCTVNDLSQQIIFTVVTSDFTFMPNCAGQASTFTDASTVNQNAVVDWHWNFGDATPVVTGTSTPTHVYTNPGNYTVTLTSYSTEGCTATSTHTITIPAQPVPTLTGSATSCTNGPNLTYTTDPGKSNYVWTIPPQATKISGGGPAENTVTLHWNTIGTWVIGVNYTIPATLCTADNATTLSVAVQPMSSPVITGENPTCLGVPGKTYTTEPGKTFYNWVLPPQATPTAGGTAANNFVTVTWTAAGTFSIHVNYTDPVSQCIPDVPGVIAVTVNPSPTVNAVAGQVLCHNAQTSPVLFTGTIPGTTYSWTNSDATIGLAATGNSDILPFTATNTGNAPVVATITVTPTYTNAGLTCTGPPASFSITVNPIPAANAPVNQVLCPGTQSSLVSLTGNVAGTVYTWSNDNTSIGLAAAGTGDIAAFTAVNTSFAPVTANITVTPSFTNAGITCAGPPASFTITVNPQPDVNVMDPQVLCHNTTSTQVLFTGDVPSTIYSWTNTNPSIGLAASGTGDIASFTATNITIVPQTATIDIHPSFTNSGATCNGTPHQFIITVNPIPVITPVTSQVLCHNTATAPVHFTADVAGTTYTWTNTNTTVGLGAAGTGDISSFTAFNVTNAPVTATISATPFYTNAGPSCTGLPTPFTFTVNPIPTVNATANQVICNNMTSSQVPFTGSVPGTVYSWTSSNGSIGLATAGTGDISAFTATNTTNAPVTTTVTVTPSFTNGAVTCTGAGSSFNITVNPTPTVSAVANQVLCHQFLTSAVSFSGYVPGTVYAWTNSNTTIGLAAAGTGNIAGFTATNTTGSPVTATITITPFYTSAGVTCTGLPGSFTITVNPLPVPTITGPAMVCLNVPATYNTEDFQSGYFWNVVAGGNLVSGQGSKQVVVNWTVIGTHSLTVNYVDANGCTAQAATSRQIVVNSLPSPTISGATTVCAGDTKTYQTQAGATSYTWGLPPSGFIPVAGGGSLDDFVTIKWTVAGSYTVSVNYMVGTGCTAAVPTNYGVTVNPLPAPQITGSSPVCALSTQNYTLTPVIGGHLYNWSVTGGTILAGQNGSTVQVLWSTAASGSLDLTETIGYPGISCSAPANTFPVVLNPWPVAAGLITGQNSVCKTSTYTYSVPVIANATSYNWIYSGAGVTITNNGNATITITFSAAATSGALTVKGVNLCGNGPDSPLLNIAVHNLPEVAFNACFDLVTTSGAKKIVLRGGTPWLTGQGVYTGARVALNALTGFYEFDPFGAPSGNYSITYGYTNTFGCMASAPAVTISVQNSAFACGGTLTDVRDGKTYKTAWLAGRCWMTENLAYGTTLVSPGLPQTDNCVPEKYCSPADATCTTFGGMYQWDEMMDYAITPAVKGICPPEWHVPTQVEWQSLIDNLLAGIVSPDANALVGSTLKDVLIFGGFHGLLGGLNYEDNYWAFTNGTNTGTQYWTSTTSSMTQSISRGLNIFTPSISLYSSSRGNAFSVRCIKN